MKTGYTEASGHNLVTSAVNGGVRLIGVVLGASTNGERDLHMAALLNQGFEEMNVPVERHPTVIARASLIGSAHAATIDAADVTPMRTHETGIHWAIQVGSFSTEHAAREAANVGRRAAEGGDARVEAATLRHRTAWRAEVIGLTEQDAQAACSALAHHRMPCLVLRPTGGQVASR
jgi:D-alanyl-D-alanine carboxypeptidase